MSAYPGDAFAAPDPPDYPHDWTPAQRLRAYWFAHEFGATGEHAPQITADWIPLLAQADRHADKVHERVAALGLDDPEVPW